MQIIKSLKCQQYRSAGPGLALVAVALACGPAFAGGGAAKEAGVWIDDTGKGAVKVEPCGAKLCGTIVWLRDPLNTKGEPLTDKHNPDAGKQKRAICGLSMMGDLQALPEGGFDGGWIYDPKEGKSYSVAVTLAGPNQLHVTGYLGLKLLGKSFIWTRATEPLPSCNVAPAATPDAAPPAPAKVTGTGGAAGAAKPVATKEASGQKAGSAAAGGEKLPWNSQKPPATGQKAPAGASQLGAGAVKPAAKATTAQPPAKKFIQQHPAAGSSY